MEEFFSVDVEGGDQVGKGDVVKNLSLQLATEGYDVSVVSFPCYASPIGNAVRSVLKEDIFDNLGLDPKESVSSKMALFALNRLEILNYIVQDREGKVFLFDRGPFSNALTIAYAVSKGLDGVNQEELVDIALSLDFLFIKNMKVDECVIRIFTESNSWCRSREDGDLHESREVQDISDLIYGIFQSKIKGDWVDILSKGREGWRSREEIKGDCLKFIRKRNQLSPVGLSKEPKYLLVGKALQSLYKDSRIDSVELNLLEESLKQNEKQGMYEASSLISQGIANSTEGIEWYNDEIRDEVKRILGEHIDILSLLEGIYGKEFVYKFLKSLNTCGKKN